MGGEEEKEGRAMRGSKYGSPIVIPMYLNLELGL